MKFEIDVHDRKDDEGREYWSVWVKDMDDGSRIIVEIMKEHFPYYRDNPAFRRIELEDVMHRVVRAIVNRILPPVDETTSPK